MDHVYPTMEIAMCSVHEGTHQGSGENRASQPGGTRPASARRGLQRLQGAVGGHLRRPAD